MISTVRNAAFRTIILAVLGLPLAVASSHAALIGSCTITVLAAGTLASNPAINILSSANAGGSAASVRVVPSSLLCSVLNLLDCFSFSAPAPLSFLSAPAGGGDGVSHASNYRINGAPATPGSTVTRLTNGTHMVAVDLASTRVAGVFPAGNYQAEVTVRCE